MQWEGEKKRLDMLVKDILRTEDTPSVCSSYQLVWAVRSNQTHMKEGFPFDRLAAAWREVQPCFSGPSLLSVPWPSFARPWPWSRLFAGHLMKMTGPLLVPYSLPWDPAVPTGILHSTLPYALHHAQGQEAIKVFWNKNLKGWKYLDWGLPSTNGKAPQWAPASYSHLSIFSFQPNLCRGAQESWIPNLPLSLLSH